MKQEKEDKSMTLTQTIKEYIDLKLEYFRLAFAESVSLLVGNIIFLMLIALLGLAALLMISLLMYNVLIAWIDIAWVVSFILIAFVGLIAVFLWIFREKLVVKPVANIIIRTLIDPSGKFKIKEEDEIEE
jgi:hypothetical protein